MERNIKLNELKNKHKLPENFKQKFPELSKLIIKMTDNNPEKRPNSKTLLKMIRSELSLDFKSKDDEYSMLKCSNANSSNLNAKSHENNKNRLRVFSEDLHSKPAYEFKMKNLIENSWKKM